MQSFTLLKLPSKTLLKRPLPSLNKFILTGESGSGKSSLLYQYLATKEQEGHTVVYLDANAFFTGKIPYFLDKQYRLKMENYPEETIVGIDNINSFLGYTEYLDRNAKTLHALEFGNIIDFLNRKMIVGAESTVFKYASNSDKTIDTTIYKDIPKVVVPALSLSELDQMTNSEHIHRTLMLTGGIFSQINRMKPFEKINRVI